MTDTQVRNAIAVLAVKTQDGELRWEKSDPPSNLTRTIDARIDLCYLTSYEGKNLRLYERKERSFISEYEDWYWGSSIILEMIDDEGRTLDTFPNVTTLNELWSAVRSQISGINNFIGNLTGSLAS